MALILDTLVGILRKPTILGVLTELALFCGPLWVAVFVGLVVGWVWKPKWASELVGGQKEYLGESRFPSKASPHGFSSFDSDKAQSTTCSSMIQDQSARDKENDGVMERDSGDGGAKLAVIDADLQHLSRLVEERDGGPAWIQMMDRSLPNMSYQAWRRDPETGPPQYRSRTLFEDATPETVRDFFWDDDFRIKARWDDMLLYHKILEECSITGTLIVHWIRKFPFFCSDREYIIGRRIWNSDGAFYCVTKGVPYADVPRRSKPRRVDLYYSSWCIRAAESRRDGRMTACEVLLFHHEDMGIPWEVAKFGIRQGMWGTVKKIEPGLRAYQAFRESGEVLLSRCVLMGRINSKVSAGYLQELESNNVSSAAAEGEDEHCCDDKPLGRSVPRLALICGAFVLACTLDRGLLTKAVIFGVARKFAKAGR